MFSGYTGISLSVYLSLYLSVCLSVYKILVILLHKLLQFMNSCRGITISQILWQVIVVFDNFAF